MTPVDVKKILVVTLSNLGDVVLTLPVFESLKTQYPGARMDVLVGPSGSAVFESDDRIGAVIVHDRRREGWRGRLALLAWIRAARYDVIVDLRHSLFGLLGGAHVRNRYPLARRRRTRHRALKHLESLEGLVRHPDPERTFLRLTPEGRASADALLSGLGPDAALVVAAPGSKSHLKQWPAERYAALLDRLCAGGRMKAVLVGDAADSVHCARVRLLMREPVLDLSGRTRFASLAAVLARAALVITNDSAPLHVADALKVPTLALFGPTDPRKYGTRFAHSLSIRKNVFCAPCERARCRHHHECMNELGVDEAHARAEAVLKGEFVPRRPRILVVRLDRIGDLVLSIPCLEALRRHYPEATLSVMTRPYTREVLEGHPLVDEVIPYQYEDGGRHSGWLGGMRFVREIIQRRFDIAFILHPGTRSVLVPFLAGIPYRIGYDRGPSYLLTRKVEDRRHEGLKHEADYALDVVRAFGVPAAETPRPFLEPGQEAIRAADEKLAAAGVSPEERLVAVHPGASCPSKRWPIDRFAAWASEVTSEPLVRVVVVGAAEEAELAHRLKDAAPGRVSDLTGRLSLRELSAVLSRARLLVANDSGPVHVAAAVGTPTLTVFGRSRAGLNVERWKALGAGHRYLHKDVGCVVCLAHRCTIGYECLAAVSTDEVVNLTRSMLAPNAAVPA